MHRQIIGQHQFIRQVKAIQSLPSFCILEGAEGQGKHTMANWLSAHFNYRMLTIGNKIDDIRSMISTTVNLSTPTIYFIEDGDSMSVGAKNSLLKITEEPPKNLYIIMALTHSDNTLATIKSRARVLSLDNYTSKELQEYVCSKYDVSFDTCNSLLEVATNPGEIDELMHIGFEEFIAYVDKVYENILAVSTGNSFKIANKLKFKKDDEGYCAELFLKVFQKISCDSINPMYVNPMPPVEEIEVTVQILRATNEALADMRKRGINKKAVFDMWLLNVRRFR